MATKNTKEEEVEIYTWKNKWEGGEDYNIQVEIKDCGKRAQKKIMNFFKDWRLAGQGSAPKKKKTIYVFRKEFESAYFWKKWIKESPYTVYKRKRDGSYHIVNKGK